MKCSRVERRGATSDEGGGRGRRGERAPRGGERRALDGARLHPHVWRTSFRIVTDLSNHHGRAHRCPFPDGSMARARSLWHHAPLRADSPSDATCALDDWRRRCRIQATTCCVWSLRYAGIAAAFAVAAPALSRPDERARGTPPLRAGHERNFPREERWPSSTMMSSPCR